MINSGDTAYVLICSAMVLLMTPALAFFYGGLVRRKNVLNTMMSSYMIIGISSVMWVLVGYSLSFSSGGGPLSAVFGDLRWFGMNGVGWDPNADYAGTIPHIVFASFQMMFAIITPALITGAIAERMRFSALMIFTPLWLLAVYYPLAHMVWGKGGFIASLGAVDFAGGNVVHISSGVSALVLCILLGKRKNHGRVKTVPHNVPFVLLGAGLLAFGWFGFNSGSALAANGLAAHAFLTTNTAAAAAMISWIILEMLVNKKPTVLGAATALVVGLVAITPAAGFVPIWASIIIGAVVSPLCWFSIGFLKEKLGYDDALDAFGCHGIGGIWGGIATGLFAQTSINAAAKHNGLIFGDTGLIVAQLEAIGITIVLAAVGTFVIAKLVSLVVSLRVPAKVEANGLDIVEHGETAYPSFTGLD
jgi:ammonium transporter, Amt family